MPVVAYAEPDGAFDVMVGGDGDGGGGGGGGDDDGGGGAEPGKKVRPPVNLRLAELFPSSACDRKEEVGGGHRRLRRSRRWW